MADGNGNDGGIPWYSWLILGFHLLVSGGLFYFMHSVVVPLGLIWAVSGGWVLLALIFGLIDFVFRGGAPGSTDSTAFDRWTIVHFGAGLVFGIWYVPLLWVVVLALLWECFEFSVAGFGDQEVISNRLVDIGAAVVGWLIVVIVLMAAVRTSFPFAMPVTAPTAQQAAPVASPHQTQHKATPARGPERR